MMDEKIIDILQGSSWFHSLPIESLNVLSNKVITHSLKKDDYLIKKGDAGDSVFYIHSGWVKIVAGDTLGGEVVLNHLGSGEFVGELSLVDQKPRSASVIGLSEVEALELKREDFLEVLEDNPTIALGIIANISSRMRFSSTYVEKAIQWSQKVAKGDYEFASDEIESKNIVDANNEDGVRANRFLDAFYSMVSEIKEREDKLKRQLKMLTIEIDRVKRDEEIDAIFETDSFKKIKLGAERLQNKRDKIKNNSED